VRVIFAGGGTGGHLYPGLAIARALVRLRPDAQPFFVGAQRGVERDVLPSAGFAHELLDLHPLYRQAFWNNWKTIRGAVGAWRRAGALTREPGAPEAGGGRVRMVVGTGGYASGLMLGYAAAHRIPYVLQEQNSYPGLTMRVFARWAREIYLGFPEAERLLRRGKTTRVVDAGNPIEPPPVPRPDRAAARRGWKFPEQGGRVLLIFGGSQGARAINETVDAWLAAERLPDEVFLIWATGRGTYEQFRARESERVRVRAYIAPMQDAYAAADLAVARAGAMSTAEMCAWGIPQILVPLPTAAADHQTHNARTLAAANAGVFVPQADFTPHRLDALVRELAGDAGRLDALAAGARARARPDAADQIARRIAALIDGR
jgi:UDP-N-acetylglucosamine--N-acetylmuramyl-(pentapeptide) pyrophosphoryl-undecaprenol N-acetylglucosamine transferase